MQVLLFLALGIGPMFHFRAGGREDFSLMARSGVQLDAAGAARLSPGSSRGTMGTGELLPERAFSEAIVSWEASAPDGTFIEVRATPRVLARLHPRFATPANAIYLQTAIALGLALSLRNFALLAALSVMARLVSYIGTAAALPLLRTRFPEMRDRRTPGGLVVPALALIMCVGLLASATRTNLIVAATAAPSSA